MTQPLADNIRAGYELGWSFTPLREGKKAYLDKWQKLPRETLEEALRWAAKGNVGLRTGKSSGIIVIDVDMLIESQDANYEQINAETLKNYYALDLPPTIAARTGRGGIHLYYLCKLPLGNSGDNLPLHIDVKGDGGQCVFPGSVHPLTGATYEWIDGYAPWEIGLAELPDHIYDQLTAPKTKAQPATKPTPKPKPRKHSTGTGYANTALKLELDAVASAPVGARNDTLVRAAFSLGQLIGGGVLDRATVVADLLAATSLPSGEALKTIRSGIEAGIQQPRGMPQSKRAGTQSSSAPSAPPAPLGAAQPQPVLRFLDTVHPESIQWLWPKRIALGKLTIIAGDPGLGKSFITLDMAARVSRGSPWPDHAVNVFGGVVLLSAEDDLADTIRPRLDAAGTQVEYVAELQAVDEDGKLRPFNLSADIPALELAIQQVPMCRLVIIDPISAFLGGTDSHRNAEVRALLTPLAELAAKYRVAMVAITHLRKGDGKAVYRAMGSLAFVAAARAVYAVTTDPDDDSERRRLFVPIKNNIGNDKDGLSFILAVDPSDPEAMPVVEWESVPVITTADQAMTGKDSDSGALGEAVEWLRAALALGPKAAKELIASASGDGISKATLKRAKRKIGLRAFKSGFQGDWEWELKEYENEREA